MGNVLKSKVLVGRKWNNPDIKITVTSEEIGISMSLTDFLKALALEAGNPTFMVTTTGLEKRLMAAAEDVVTGMKEETARTM